MICDFLVLIERIVDAETCGRLSFDDIDYWTARALDIAKRRKRK